MAEEILSNRATRESYDAARRHTDDQTIQATAAADVENARSATADYPRTWTDFTAAGYGRSGWWPTAERSASGWSFIVIGGLLGLFASIGLDRLELFSETGAVRPQLAEQQSSREQGKLTPQHDRKPLPLTFWGLLLVCGGAWAGRWAHQQLGSHLRKRFPLSLDASRRGAAPPASDSRKEIIKCPKCARKLRVPVDNHAMTITCPSCQTAFTHDVFAERRGRALTTAIEYLLGAHFLFAILLALNVTYRSVPLPNGASQRPLPQSTPTSAYWAALTIALALHVIAWPALLRDKAWGLVLFAGTYAVVWILVTALTPHLVLGPSMSFSVLETTTAGLLLGVVFAKQTLTNREFFFG